MREIDEIEAGQTLEGLLDAVENDEEIIITRRGKRVARLVREVASVDGDVARLAAAETPYNPEFTRQMALAGEIVHDDREILRALSK